MDTVAVMHHNPTAAQGQRLAPLPRPSGVPRASSSASQPLMWTPGRTNNETTRGVGGLNVTAILKEMNTPSIIWVCLKMGYIPNEIAIY